MLPSTMGAAYHARAADRRVSAMIRSSRFSALRDKSRPVVGRGHSVITASPDPRCSGLGALLSEFSRHET